MARIGASLLTYYYREDLLACFGVPLDYGPTRLWLGCGTISGRVSEIRRPWTKLRSGQPLDTALVWVCVTTGIRARHDTHNIRRIQSSFKLSLKERVFKFNSYINRLKDKLEIWVGSRLGETWQRNVSATGGTLNISILVYALPSKQLAGR